jgi:2-oxoglutarate ferredoxin oxidoreductase subunit gamma
MMAKKSEYHEIIITGFGGQGIILAGNILGKSATLFEKKNATLIQSYGPEARGGSCAAQVVVSDENIEYP